jgi:hypothetical protein
MFRSVSSTREHSDPPVPKAIDVVREIDELLRRNLLKVPDRGPDRGNGEITYRQVLDMCP